MEAFEVIAADDVRRDCAEETMLALSGLAAWLPRRLLLAIDIMLDVAFNGAAGPIAAAELGSRRGLDARRIEAILQRLSRVHLLKSVRGPNGGYLLAEERAAISVGAIARAVLDLDKPAEFEGCLSPSMRKVVLPMIGALHETMFSQLDAISLADLCQKSRLAGLTSTCDGMIDFVI